MGVEIERISIPRGINYSYHPYQLGMEKSKELCLLHIQSIQNQKLLYDISKVDKLSMLSVSEHLEGDTHVRVNKWPRSLPIEGCGIFDGVFFIVTIFSSLE